MDSKKCEDICKEIVLLLDKCSNRGEVIYTLALVNDYDKVTSSHRFHNFLGEKNE